MLANRLQSSSQTLIKFGFATKSLKQIKLRMKAVESIKKITKAMKMVAASKMKQDIARLERSKLFGMGSIQKIIQNEPSAQKKMIQSTGKTLLVPITTDKGLCGGVNSNIIREVKVMVKADRQAYRVFVIGDKGSVALSRPMPDLMDFAITNVETPINFPTAASIGAQVINHAQECGKILLLYNEFKNVISNVQRKVDVMNRKEFFSAFKGVVRHSPEQISKHQDIFYDFYIGVSFYNAMLNNIASEQSSRMNAMENASKNAGEIVDALTLEYNKARQAKITMELCEIISGASAV